MMGRTRCLVHAYRRSGSDCIWTGGGGNNMLHTGQQ